VCIRHGRLPDKRSWGMDKQPRETLGNAEMLKNRNR
jgi:hypothetical protein